MHLHAYRDESRSTHFDLISGGEHPRAIDLVLVISSGMLVVGFVCALMVSVASMVPSLSQWVR